MREKKEKHGGSNEHAVLSVCSPHQSAPSATVAKHPCSWGPQRPQNSQFSTSKADEEVGDTGPVSEDVDIRYGKYEGSTVEPSKERYGLGFARPRNREVPQ